jgi:hypothetical protein
MKKLLTSESFLAITSCTVLTLIGFLAFLWATAPEQWYAGKHDSRCEKTLYNESCDCYDRLVAADKARCNK